MPDTIYAIGDIHGQHDMLLDALTRIEIDGGTQARVVVLGDLVDRGNQSCAVIDTLMNGIAQGRDWTVLMGNHDRMFARFLTDGKITDPRIRSGLDWLHERLGGAATLASYGIDPDQSPAALFDAAKSAVPETHHAFLNNLPLYHETADHLFVHAGIEPRLPIKWQTEDDLIWIRDPFLGYADPHPWLIVHGHTALETPQHHGNRVNLDGGAGWGRPLIAAAITGQSVFVLSDDGRVPLLPNN